MRKSYIPAFLTLLLSLSVISCQKESYVAPYITDFITAYTDGNGFIFKICDDRGGSFRTSDTTHLRPDTLYRKLMIYEISPDSTAATIHSQSNVLASKPARPSQGDSIDDPVGIRSVWKSGGWLNIVFEIKAMDKPHRLYAVDYSTPDRTVFRIMHNENQDKRSHTKKAYMSIPLKDYAGQLSLNDTILLSYRNYDNEYIVLSVN